MFWKVAADRERVGMEVRARVYGRSGGRAVRASTALGAQQIVPSRDSEASAAAGAARRAPLPASRRTHLPYRTLWRHRWNLPEYVGTLLLWHGERWLLPLHFSNLISVGFNGTIVATWYTSKVCLYAKNKRWDLFAFCAIPKLLQFKKVAKRDCKRQTCEFSLLKSFLKLETTIVVPNTWSRKYSFYSMWITEYL